MAKPVIGILPQYSAKDARLMIGKDYFDSVQKAGGIPLLLPLFSGVADLEEILGRFDGFLYPGGPDVNPLLFGEETRAGCGDILNGRDTVEIGLLPAILRTGKPVFGICRGIQVINVALGGTLFQDLFADLGKDGLGEGVGNRMVGHYQKAGDAVQTHSVRVKKDTLLYDIVGKEKLLVNSFHHQAIKTLGANLELDALAADGVIEAISQRNHKFFLAVQWHPEHLYDSDRDMEKIWNAFIGSCEG
ncbi:MAG: gamma-glutamyl-gamma-aminobutyrate hydrolase family protein [Lachnospiraceae bacterium]|nr:gamma-glutamyl-gamma-aminobutyrate hydrolase family protein [Lachnospiraceae bacterium]